MALSREPSIVSFDVEAVRTAIEGQMDGTLHSFVEYDREDFNPIYIDDVALSYYDDEAHVMEHFARIHSYVNIDFTEMDLFTEELFPIANDVRYLVTGLDAFTLLRVYVDDEGLFVALDPDEPIQPIVTTIDNTIDRER